MEWNHQDLQTLSQCFMNTLSPQPEPRRQAESILSGFSQNPNYGLAVLRLVAEPNVPDPIHQAASVNFKNHLKARWAPPPNSNDPAILNAEKDQIKNLIVPLMLSTSPRIQGQLSEALVLIGQHDFPRQWPTLLPELISSLHKASEVGDYASVNGILGTANSIFKKFQFQYKTNDLLLDLKYCLDNFAEHLLNIFVRTAGLIDAAANADAASLKQFIESQRLCCRIFYSLNYQELPEFFEDHMNEWFTEMRKYLVNNYPGLESTTEGLALVDKLRAAVCENINLYMEKNEEEFQPYLSGFAQAVWNLLTVVSQVANRDQLAVTAIKFLTTVSTSVHHSLFAGDGVILQICQGIVVPNVRLREEDEELFEMNYIEFIRRDMEGSDVDTRRRIACELLKGIATNYKQQVTSLLSVQIQNLLTSFASNPVVDWKDKDCAIYLVVSLATKRAGGTSVSTDLVDVQNFFGTVIVPELQSQDVNGYSMLKAGALKFFMMFRNHIPKPMTLQFFPDMIRFLRAESNVVHSYAASCIEKLLLVKDEGGRPRYTSVDISPVLPQLMTNLFEALQFPESEENQYVMKCIMRVLGVADISRDIAGACITGLTLIVNKACENPKNPVFNHYVFESVAVLVKRACGNDGSLISIFETNLFPSIQKILVEDVQEFYPYALQLLAQLIELNRPPLPQSYMQIFPMLLSPETWRKPSIVPALVRLLQAFLQKVPHELHQEGRLIQVLEIFNKLVSVRSTEEQGFYVLNTVVENLDFNVIAPYMGQIWSCLFSLLQSNQPKEPKPTKFIKSLLIVMSLILVKHGSTNLVESMNGIQSNLFMMILRTFWISNLKDITGAIETKLTAVASTRLLCESQTLLDGAAAEQWGKMLNSITTLLSGTEQDRAEEVPEMPEFPENTGYSATFVRLHNAGKSEDDPLPEIRDTKEFLVTSLARLSAVNPGRYTQIIGQHVEPANQQELLRLCNSYKCQIV